MNVRDAIRFAGSAIASRDAEVLLAHLLGQDKAWLIAHSLDDLSPAIQSDLAAQVGRRASGEPLQYIIGVQEFFGLTLQVSPAVLIPRPETEHLVEAVLDWLMNSGSPARIVDVGTGSAAIAIALAIRLPKSDIVAIDISHEALSVAARNVLCYGLQNRVRLGYGDLLSGISVTGFDVVVSNPPYIPQSDAKQMQREVVEHEPHSALFADEDGLSIYRRLIPQAKHVLRTGGLLAMEFGFGQRDALADLLSGWDEVSVIDDYAGIPRVVTALKK